MKTLAVLLLLCSPVLAQLPVDIVQSAVSVGARAETSVWENGINVGADDTIAYGPLLPDHPNDSTAATVTESEWEGSGVWVYTEPGIALQSCEAIGEATAKAQHTAAGTKCEVKLEFDNNIDLDDEDDDIYADAHSTSAAIADRSFEPTVQGQNIRYTGVLALFGNGSTNHPQGTWDMTVTSVLAVMEDGFITAQYDAIDGGWYWSGKIRSTPTGSLTTLPFSFVSGKQIVVIKTHYVTLPATSDLDLLAQGNHTSTYIPNAPTWKYSQGLKTHAATDESNEAPVVHDTGTAEAIVTLTNVAVEL